MNREYSQAFLEHFSGQNRLIFYLRDDLLDRIAAIEFEQVVEVDSIYVLFVQFLHGPEELIVFFYLGLV